MRFTISALPAMALCLARLLVNVDTRWLRRTVVAAVLLLAIGQWLVLSVNALAVLPDAVAVDLPGWGRLDWFAQGEFVQWPDHGPTDHRFWVLPAAYQLIRSDHDFARRGPARVGILINQPYLNGYDATFLARADFPDIEPADFFRNRGSLPVYPQLFHMDYVLVSDSSTGDLERDHDQSTVLVTAILSDPPPEFSSAFHEIADFPLPNDDVIHVFANRTQDSPTHMPPELIPDSLGSAANLNFGDRLLLVSYKIDGDDRPVSDGTLGITLNWLALDEMDEDYVIAIKLINGLYQVWGQQEQRPAWNSYSTRDWEKGEVVQDEREIALLPGTPPGTYQIELVVRGLREDQELPPLGDTEGIVGTVEVARQPGMSVDDLDIARRTDRDLGGQVRLLGFTFESGFRAGDDIHLTLFWQALKHVDVSQTVFCHLVDASGTVWAQKDNPPVAGFYPTNLWKPGELVRDQYDVPIPTDAPPATYTLQVGMYSPETGARLPVIATAQAPADDKVSLGTFTIGSTTSNSE